MLSKALTALVALVLASGLVVPTSQASPAISTAAASWKSCPPDPQQYWIRISVRRISCAQARNLGTKAWERTDVLFPGQRWRGQVGRWFCTARAGDQAGVQLTCRKGTKTMRWAESG